MPEGFTYDFARSDHCVGGLCTGLGTPGYVINVIAAFALGVGRRALDTIIDLAQSKRRGYGKKMPLAERAVFQRVVGENDLRLRAARALMVEVLEKAWATVCFTGAPPSRSCRQKCAAPLPSWWTWPWRSAPVRFAMVVGPRCFCLTSCNAVYVISILPPRTR